ncbi:MAG TPA: HAD hydrolase-like protein [Bacteroidales bacterium]|jgi:phosphoglycolate phosphatase|nr:phosphatase [Bacteroidota bacterium]HJN05799.1 HAD hydrolase-like protein [Bacteroidales bacterium]|tara:strand:+ start:96 stop:749 length:654 start_codon:yes stop_codon:yes gene_type:complete
MQKFNNKKIIIWDWNGTLLNDANFCVMCMNKVLSKRQLQRIDVEQYRNLFTFPVKDYYEAIGFNFDLEDFEVPAMEFIDLYYPNLDMASLHAEAKDVLLFFSKLGFRQLVLSAMEHSNLVKSLTDKGIISFFDDISGINDHYAVSKLEMGKNMITKLGVPRSEILIIGDTIHDFEVALGLGVDCILVTNGHQSRERLLKTTPNVLSQLKDVTNLFQS